MPSNPYVNKLRTDMRFAVAEFRRFDRMWNELNDALNVKFAAEGRDIIARDRAKGANITLSGYMSAAGWWRDKAAMLAAVISAELAAEQMLTDR